MPIADNSSPGLNLKLQSEPTLLHNARQRHRQQPCNVTIVLNTSTVRTSRDAVLYDSLSLNWVGIGQWPSPTMHAEADHTSAEASLHFWPRPLKRRQARSYPPCSADVCDSTELKVTGAHARLLSSCGSRIIISDQDRDPTDSYGRGLFQL